MKKNYLFIGAAAIMMAGCASDDIVGDENISSGETPIAFNMETPAVTRAGSSTDAGKLNNMFIVWGEKGETNGVKAGAENIVFQNYVVKYTANTANTTTSNTNNWEYVGIDHSDFDTNVKTTIGSGKAQTIKYWDDNASSYTFTAVSALQSDIKAGNVIIEKTIGTESNDNSKTIYDKGYTIQVKSNANVGNIYYADRENIAKGQGYSHQPVELTFRNFQSKIRFGIYETVPGYKVVITGIKYTGANSSEVEHKSSDTSGDKSFGITGNFIVAGDNTKYTVTYVSTEGDDQNKAEVAVDANSATQTFCNTTGTNWLSTSWTSTTENSCIGESATAATYDKTVTTSTTTGESTTTTTDAKAYTAILPNPSNTTNLKLEISYDLYSEDTGEKISVDYKTVEVPKQYCQWKSNYAYTYLFKITDKSAELYPITFDAVVVESSTGNQETITTVDEPSITTYVKGKTASDEYAGGDEIYAYAQDGTTTVMSSTNMKLYYVTSTDATNFPITEASVKHAIEQAKKTSGKPTSPKIVATEITSSTTGRTDQPSYTDAIPREDNTEGRAITGMKWKATASTTYAVEYIKTTGEGQNTTTTKYYKIVKIAQKTTTNP